METDVIYYWRMTGKYDNVVRARAEFKNDILQIAPAHSKRIFNLQCTAVETLLAHR
jgi:hypothetical protein